jgi:hypothetical protein
MARTLGEIDARTNIFAKEFHAYGACRIGKRLHTESACADGVRFVNDQFSALIESAAAPSPA